MPQPADLYTILRFYANRTRTPVFTVEAFIAFLDKYAKRYMEERPDLAHWAQDTPRKVHDVLPTLAEAGKCVVAAGERGLTVTVNQYFVDALQQKYREIDEMPELPFPDETAIKAAVPPNLFRLINIETDLETYLANPQTGPLPLLKFTFPEGSGPVFVLPGMVPRKLLELALLKARHYLRSHNNKDYILHKLLPAFQGKESMLKDTVNQLLVRPFDSLMDLEKAGDFSFPFWAYFSNLVKSDIKKKNDKLPEDYAVLQAVMLIDFFNNYYKSKVQKEQQAETALRLLDLQLDKAPFHYTIEDVRAFKDTRGIPLLGQYTRESLEGYLKDKTTDTQGLEQLPELLVIKGPGGERWYIKKSKLLPLCVRLLGETRPRIKSAITQRWFKLMSDYKTEAAMEDDDAFDAELAELTETANPVLACVMKEKILALVHEELEGTEAGIPEAGRLFYKGALASLSELYLLARKDLLVDVRMMLPFWYSMPVLSRLIAFFKGLGKSKPNSKKRAEAKVPEIAPKEEAQHDATSKMKREELRAAARAIEKKLVPPEYNLDDYLVELEERWNRLISPQLKENLTEDVNSLIRDYLRRSARNLKASTFTAERIEDLAKTLSDSPNLLKIPARDSLRLYIQLYMVRIVAKS